MSAFTQHVRAAIDRLGYIGVDHVDQISAALEAHPGIHPFQIARQIRQTGVQLSKEVKKAVGLRSNTAMSEEALAMLTAKGLSSPLQSLENTLLAAYFDFSRFESVARVRAAGYDTFEISAIGPMCPGCERLDGHKVSGDFVASLPPPDCGRDACMTMMVPHIDFLADLE